MGIRLVISLTAEAAILCFGCEAGSQPYVAGLKGNLSRAGMPVWRSAMAKESAKQTNSVASRVQETTKSASAPAAQPRSAVRTMVTGTCEDCRATNAFQAWHSIDMTPSFNWLVSFDDWNIVPTGKRAVIELVTAQIIVPEGEWARLRMLYVAWERPLEPRFVPHVPGECRR